MPRRARARALALGAIAIVAVGLAVYGLASRPESEPDAIEIHRAIERTAESPRASTGASTGTPTLAVPVTVPETIEPVAPPEPASAAPVAPTPGWDRAMPEPASSAGPIPPPSYPSLADRRGDASGAVATTASAGPAAAPVAGAASAVGSRAMDFGSPEVARGRTTTLRMSAAVQSIEGQSDAGGFTVTVHGALSLDRAAPLAAANSVIERASIINRGDHCVLTIRFVTGRTPTYRVSAHDTSLDVTIGR